MDLTNDRGMSPYRHHQETATAYNTRRDNKGSQDAVPQRGTAERDRRGSTQQASRSGGEVHGNAQQPDLGQNTAPNQGLFRKTNTMDTVAPGKYTAGSARGLFQATPPLHGPPIPPTDINQGTGGERGGVVSERAAKTVAKSRPVNRRVKSGPKQEVMPSPESAKAIKKLLKVHYLRTRKHDEAVDFLYNPLQGKLRK